MDTALIGKVVLVTGASGGIGRATARTLAEEGAIPVLHYFSNEDAARELARELGGDALPVRADLSDETQTDAMFTNIIDHFGRVDAVVANAGTWASETVPICDMSLAQWKQIIDWDLTSAFLTCRGYLQHLKASPRLDASIVLVGSTAAIVGEAGNAEYAAAKSGMTYGLMLSLKNEIVRLAPRGRVNSVCPGWVNTPAAMKSFPDDAVMKRVCATIALNKIATAEDCANAIVFLTSDKLAGHLSGVVLPVSGGMEGRVIHEM
jgi:3-oxoacyl-[acyl-carrier protein] reductase